MCIRDRMMADTELTKLYVSRNQYSFWEFMGDQIHELFNGDPGTDIYDDTGDMGSDEYTGISQPDARLSKFANYGCILMTRFMD